MYKYYCFHDVILYRWNSETKELHWNSKTYGCWTTRSYTTVDHSKEISSVEQLLTFCKTVDIIKWNSRNIANFLREHIT